MQDYRGQALEEGMNTARQTFMFSATFPTPIQRLASDFMQDYIFLAVGRVGAASKDVTQRVEYVEQHHKIDFVVDFLSRLPQGLVLVFVETRRSADHLEEVLCRETRAKNALRIQRVVLAAGSPLL